MTKALKPLSSSQRDIIRKMAAILVCAEIEVRAIAPQFEKSTGKKYNSESAISIARADFTVKEHRRTDFPF